MIRVGLIGFGLAGRVFHAPLIRANAGLELAAIATRRPDEAAAAAPGARACSVDELIAARDIDLVVIAAPNDVHGELGERALAAGKAVVVDKPMTPSLTSARRLADAAERAGRPLAVFHNRRWDDDFLTLKQVLAAGRIGPLVTFESRFDRYRPAVPDRWRDRPGAGAGVWWDLGPHLIDQALQLMGRPDAVTADLARQRRGASVDDYVHVVLHFGTRRAVLRAGCLVSAPTPRLAADCETGAFTTFGFDPQEGMLREGADARDPQPDRWGEVRVQDGGTAPQIERRRLTPGDYAAFYEGMRTAVETGAPVPVSVASALEVMQLLELAQLSADQRRTVEVPRATG